MRFLKWLYLISLYVLLLALATFKIEDNDTMQYLLNGKIILTQGLYANFCSFNYFLHTCQLAYTHEWLFNVLTYIFYQIGGWNALEFFQIVIIVAVFSTIVFSAKLFRSSLLSTGMLFFLALFIAKDRFMLSPDLIGILFFVLFYTTARYFIENNPYVKKGIRSYLPLATLFVVQVIWANTHGSFPLAFVVILSYIASYLIRICLDFFFHKKAFKFVTPRFKALLLILFITLVASIINPYGLRTFFDSFNPSQYIDPTVTEWQSPFLPSNYVYFSIVAYKIMLIFSLCIMLINFRKIKLADFFILLAFIYLSVNYERNIALFAVFCAIILPYYLDEGFKLVHRIFGDNKQHSILVAKQITMVLAIVLSIYYLYQIVTNNFYVWDEQVRVFGIGLSEKQYPIGAASFVQQNDLTGNMFNDYSIGTYLNWRFYPKRKTFIDSKNSTLESIDYYDNIMLGRIPYNALANKYNINYFILNHVSGDTIGLIRALYFDNKWVLVYFDERSAIFIKNTPQNRGVIDKYAINLETNINYDPDKLPTFTDPTDFPYGFTARGALLYNLGLYNEATYEFQKAVGLGTNYYSAYLGLGNAYTQQGQTILAQNAYQKAVELAPNNASTHFNLGAFYLHAGEYDQALREFNETLAINSNFPYASAEILEIYEMGK